MSRTASELWPVFSQISSAEYILIHVADVALKEWFVKCLSLFSRKIFTLLWHDVDPHKDIIYYLTVCNLKSEIKFTIKLTCKEMYFLDTKTTNKSGLSMFWYALVCYIIAFYDDFLQNCISNLPQSVYSRNTSTRLEYFSLPS